MLFWGMRDPREHLVAANRHLAAGVCRVADQRARCERLRFGGHPTQEAERFLYLLERTLIEMYGHQRLLQAEMAEWHRLHNAT